MQFMQRSLASISNTFGNSVLRKHLIMTSSVSSSPKLSRIPVKLKMVFTIGCY